MMRFTFATHNQNKVLEVNSILQGLNVRIDSLSDLGIHDEIVEDGATLDENAWIKANYIYQQHKGNVIAEDTGLEVDSLGGAPGVYSARYAGSHRSDLDNMNKLLETLKHKKDRSAQFRTVLAVYLDGDAYTFEGIVRGKIGLKRSGKKGFGYDPLFIPEGYKSTFGQLSSKTKNRISHRGRAFKAFKDFLSNY